MSPIIKAIFSNENIQEISSECIRNLDYNHQKMLRDLLTTNIEAFEAVAPAPVEAVATFGDVVGSRRRSIDMLKCFTDEQLICHKKTCSTTWYGTYDCRKNKIICGKDEYDSLTAFGEAHYRVDRPDRGPSCNGWDECECYVNGEWIKTGVVHDEVF